MGIILSKDKEEIIKILKKTGDHVFKVTKEVIYAISKDMTAQYSDYNDFLKFAKEHPDKVFQKYYYILEEIKNIEEL